MFIAKNIFVYLLSMLALCLLIILFNYLGMNETTNLVLSSALFGIFITWYYKGSGLCLALFSFFYWAMFVISQSLEVIWMFSISVIVYLIMTKIIPKLKYIQIGITSNVRTDLHHD
ncbi:MULTISPECIES: hypothetical protein [Acinetobacter]|uniref:hypothetical protein n=1 Tax=Acinetobacter TaxID=469 RepID=UPI0005582533|nr:MULTISPECIES: hypothetical protein [Acinetobacter]MBM7140501.1 hypothetical protein [Acinetobacter sp. 105-3]